MAETSGELSLSTVVADFCLNYTQDLSDDHLFQELNQSETAESAEDPTVTEDWRCPTTHKSTGDDYCCEESTTGLDTKSDESATPSVEVAVESASQPNIQGGDVSLNEDQVDEKVTASVPPKRKEWAGVKRKRLRENGLAYVCCGMERPAKKMKSHCACNSRSTQCRLITEIDQQKCFTQVWDMSWQEKKAFVMGLVDKTPKKVTTTPKKEDSRRDFSFTYYLKKDGRRIKVCQKLFLNTTALTTHFIYSVFSDSKETEPSQQKSVKRNHPYYDRRAEDKRYLKEEFFNKLSKLPSHSCHKSSSKLYLEPSFKSLAEVHRFYSQTCAEANRKPLGYETFVNMFHEQNLSLFQLKKDKKQCDLCVSYEAGNVSTDACEAAQLKKQDVRSENSESVEDPSQDTRFLTTDNSRGDDYCCEESTTGLDTKSDESATPSVEVAVESASQPNIQGGDVSLNEDQVDEKVTASVPPKRKEWAGVKRKRLRENGLAYVCCGMERPAKKMKSHCACNSRATQCRLITEIDQQKCFTQVWDMSWQEKKAFVMGLVHKTPKKVTTTPKKEDSRRDFSFTYYLKKDGRRVKVCQKLFLNTTALTTHFIYSVFSDNKETEPSQQMSVKRNHPYYDRRAEDKRYLKEEFFDKLSKLPSHYCHKSSSKLYLEPSFKSLAEVHRFYSQSCTEANRKPLGYETFVSLFHELNLSLFQPKKDKKQCDLCVSCVTCNISQDACKSPQLKKQDVGSENSESAEDSSQDTRCLTTDNSRGDDYCCEESTTGLDTKSDESATPSVEVAVESASQPNIQGDDYCCEESTTGLDTKSDESVTPSVEVAVESASQPNIQGGDVNLNEDQVDEKVTASVLPKRKEWAGVKRKRLRENGLAYVCCGMERPAKKMKSHCACNSRTTQCRLITEIDQQKCFTQVWDMSWQEKKAFVMGLVDKTPTKTTTKPKKEDSRRDFSFTYYLKKDGPRIKVCHKLFVNTTALTTHFIYSVFRDNKETESSQQMSVKRNHPYYDRSAADKRYLKEHFFDKLPKLPSHYCRKSSSKLYLEPSFKNLSEVYRFYSQTCTEANRKPLGYDTFVNMFHELNLSLFQPKKDQCDLCVSYEAGNVSTDAWEAHQLKKQDVCSEKEEDKKRALNTEEDDKLCVACVDLQCVLLAPSLKASQPYYRSKLAVHNVTLCDVTTQDVDCYLWHEGEGDLTANEISSCIADYISSRVKDFNHFIIYCDGSTFENQNSILAATLSYLAKEMNITIEQKYLIKGHAEMEVDSVQIALERSLRNTAIHVPSDYARVMQTMRQKQRPYTVHQLDHTFFKDYAKVGYCKTMWLGRTGEEVTMTDVQALRYTPDGVISYKLNFRDEWNQIPQPRGQRKRQSPSPLYTSKLKIKERKFKDLQQLKAMVPADYHAFFDSLNHE